VASQSKLLEVVAALHASGSLADFLDGRQEQTNEDGNDSDDDQQLNKCEASLPRPFLQIQHGVTTLEERRRTTNRGILAIEAQTGRLRHMI
jgi:hypothetical protein